MQHAQERKSRNKRASNLIPVDGPQRVVVDAFFIIFGAFVMSIAFNLFLVPNLIASGGVSGISILGQAAFGFEPAFTQWALNIPLFIAGYSILGRQYAIRSLLGSVMLPLFVFLTKDWTVPTSNPLLASIFGGIGVGLGIGIVYRGRGSTGGLTILAQIIQKYSGLRLSLSVMLLDGAVIVLAGMLLSLENSLYALISLYVTGKVIDAVEMGFGTSKVAYIISNHTEPITKSILHDLDRGVTKLSAQGGYTDDDRTVLMVVVGQSEIARLKTLVRAVDPNAFVTITNAHEVLGEGFKKTF
ncbi:YitT family protein [Paenibacillus provencensis]|uniref:YitT family protein n=1 Tax=Paenibacillus provencensis TaxID=441151 RepID=A0ABW3PT18_9BACL|nr:YitT family protein [Paenibacillus sp. MER 78]MCM3128266.1 YitT family protein [Paenibacillus sp. MER 78]